MLCCTKSLKLKNNHHLAARTQLLQDGQEQTSLRNSKTKLEDSVQKLQKQLNELKHGRQKFSLEVTALTEKEAALKQQIKASYFEI